MTFGCEEEDARVLAMADALIAEIQAKVEASREYGRKLVDALRTEW